MSAAVGNRVAQLIVLLFFVGVFPTRAWAQLDQHHTVEAIEAAIQLPISPQAIAQARAYDDGILSSGQTWNHQIYLVTDERYTRVAKISEAVLKAAGEDPNLWVVRVLDTNPKILNAFVQGGKYIYVFTGLLDQQPSDDELGLILSHETGHSLLKHLERRAEDRTTTVAGLANLAALLSPKNKDLLNGVSQSLTIAYSRLDEEEADAVGVCIARRAGFDPVRGVEFYTKMIRGRDAERQHREQALAQAKADYEQSMASCTQNRQLFNSSRSYQTQSNADKVNALCAEAERRRLHYNDVVEWYNAQVQNDQRNVLLNDHPQDQARVATIVELTDFLAGRRDLQSLANHQQSYRVIAALQQVRGDLVKADPGAVQAVPAARDSTPPTSPGQSLEEQLKQLQRAHDKGLITDQEYEQKRKEILARF